MRTWLAVSSLALASGLLQPPARCSSDIIGGGASRSSRSSGGSWTGRRSIVLSAGQDKQSAQVPVIDMSALLESGSQARAETVAEIGDACAKWGFFQVADLLGLIKCGHYFDVGIL